MTALSFVSQALDANPEIEKRGKVVTMTTPGMQLNPVFQQIFRDFTAGQLAAASSSRRVEELPTGYASALGGAATGSHCPHEPATHHRTGRDHPQLRNVCGLCWCEIARPSAVDKWRVV
jgi:hypothetical protein